MPDIFSRENRRKLKVRGWQILKVWGTDLEKHADRELEKIAAFLLQK